MNKKLYIHIGFPKAGSTSLQTFLATNQRALQEEDYFYPLTSDYYQHEWAFKYIDESRLPRKLSVSPQFGLELSQQLSQSIHTNTVMSSENFTWAPYECDLDRLFQDVKEFSTRIVAIVRPQIEFLNSMYCETIQGFERQETWTFEEFIASVHAPALDYGRVLSMWAEVFGGGSISPIVMSPGYGTSDRLFRDFLSLIGWPADKNVKLEFSLKPANVSLDHDVLEVLRNARRRLGYMADREQWLRLVNVTSEVVKVEVPARKAWFSDARLQQAIHDQFSESNRKVGQVLNTPEVQQFNRHNYADNIASDHVVSKLAYLTDRVVERFYSTI